MAAAIEQLPGGDRVRCLAGREQRDADNENLAVRFRFGGFRFLLRRRDANEEKAQNYGDGAEGL